MRAASRSMNEMAPTTSTKVLRSSRNCLCWIAQASWPALGLNASLPWSACWRRFPLNSSTLRRRQHLSEVFTPSPVATLCSIAAIEQSVATGLGVKTSLKCCLLRRVEEFKGNLRQQALQGRLAFSPSAGQLACALQHKQLVEDRKTFVEVVGAISFIDRDAARIHQFTMDGVAALMSKRAGAPQRSVVTAKVECNRGVVDGDGGAGTRSMGSP